MAMALAFQPINYCSNVIKPIKNKQKLGGPGGAFGNILEVVKKDFDFVKKGFNKGVEWANKNLPIPKVTKTIDDVVWLRYLENTVDVSPPKTAPWPQPYYPELSGVDLLLADLRALEAYISYFHYVSWKWKKPLPESYDPEEVANYFSLRPHVVALRLLQVFAAFSSAAIKMRISSISSSKDDVTNQDISQYNFGMLLKETMLHLGPTFIKIGQSLSTRPDIIGTEISKALSELHEQIPSFPRAEAYKIMEEELGSPVGNFFSYISEEPVAAASFGQVYRGRTLDGLDVAVKVQRPNLQHVVFRDIYILRLGLGIIRKVARRKSDPRLYADELGKGLVGELDYTLEAANAQEFKEVHSPYPFICVPKVFQHLTRKRILTMEWIVGDSPRDLLFLSTESLQLLSGHKERLQYDAKRRLLDMVNKGVEASLIQLLETGLLHADPHPGNLRYISAEKIGFLDFGLLCRMEKRHQFAMLSSIVHIVYGEWGSLVQALVEMDVVPPGTNTLRVTMELEDALGEMEFNNGIPDIKFSRVLGKIWSVALKYHFRMPPYYTLVLRSLASLEGLAVAADPNFKTFEAAYPYVVRKLLTDNSASARKILHSVVFNRRKEFQWQKISLFLRVGATRKLQLVGPNSQVSREYSSNGVAEGNEVANLILKLLPSKDGIVLRRILMTANGTSFVQAMVSPEAKFYRQHICGVIADAFYLWLCNVSRISATRFSPNSHLARGTGDIERHSASRLRVINEYQSLVKDRRLRVIFSKMFNSTRKNPLLMLRVYWTSFVVLVTAAAMAFHRVLITLCEDGLARISVARERIALGA
ncbi:OLC1v1025990C1 [Oldenlandia corymbosa var. corymbosa]|uniref:OLC1v1025990C1 n=1 Tax=Oldenlandia corymbosa var. corymbosa TaxID=529605 RepID=A0AAV1C6J4_OLDCO|nr:OLC1v1025990C1 [Oldenlandia corymbosa var. corymbosa]